MALKIMPLGDSITYGVVNGGDTETGGYRTELWNLFDADNFDVDLVGSISSGPNDIDKDHDGNRGWRIDQISDSVNQWLDSYQPEVILLMIGTNDILQNYQVSTAHQRLSNLIDQITNKLPNAELFVSSLLPIKDNNTQQQQVVNFNSHLPGIVNAKVSQGKNVSLVDIFSKVNFSDLSDRVHPTIDGYTKIANAWYEALQPLTGIKDAMRVQAEDMNLTNYIVESRVYSALQRKVISLNGTTHDTGTASFNFAGNSGLYDVIVSYYDENDGKGNLAVKIGGNQVDSWNLNQNLGSSGVNRQTKLLRTVAQGIYLNQGTVFEIEGTANKTEYARVDYVEFVPKNAASTTSLSAQNISEETSENYTFSITYNDDDGVDISSIDNQYVRVTGENGFNQLASLMSVNNNDNGSPRTATYRINAPGGSWDTADNGNYTIALQSNQVRDTDGNYFVGGNVGSFQVNIPSEQSPVRIEAENMQRNNYQIESSSAASNGQLIKLSSSRGTASTTFYGASGIYDVILGYFDESDGESTVTTKINGTQIDQHTFNQSLGSSTPSSQNAVSQTIATSVYINQGDSIQLEGVINGGEFARIDYIELVNVSSSQSTQIVENSNSVDSLTGDSFGSIMKGTADDDSLNGSDSNDTLIGGTGNDVLIGGGGQDLFVLGVGEGADTIMDFVDGEDKLGLSGNLSYSQLMLSPVSYSNGNDTLIKVASTGELLATVVGIPVSNISVNDFVNV